MTILGAAVGYYDRHAGESDAGLPPYGYNFENIAFALVLDADGKLIDVEQVAEPNSGLRIAVPKDPRVTRTSGIASMFLWDKTSYVLGLTATQRDRTAQEHKTFKTTNCEIIGAATDPGLVAVRKFLEAWQPAQDALPRYGDELVDKNVAFRLAGETGYIHERSAATEAWQARLLETSGAHGACLVSGRLAPIALTHPQIGGVRDAQSSGAALMSFNLDAFRSYGKEQNANAPVSEEVAFKYTAALNHLLRKGSSNRLQIGDATTVFWAEAETADAASSAEGFFAALAQPPDDSDETATLRSTLKRFEEGRPLEALDLGLDETTRFYVLGLSPNAARLSVRFWHDTTLDKLARGFQQHWRDMHFEQPRRQSLPPSVSGCALMTAPARTNAQGQLKFSFDDVSPLLAGELMRAVLSGNRYPGALLSNLIMRIRSDGVLHPTRMALIKAIIVRAMRFEGRLPYEEYLMRSDPDDPNEARRLGRLFALIERAQTSALGDKLNATVKDKFIGSAAATPRNVFPGLIKNAELHHIARLRRGHADADWIKDPEHARRTGSGLQREIGKLVASFPEGPPAQLNIEDQGLFFVGYYQERFGGRPDQDIGPEPGVDTEIENSDNEE